MPNATPPPTFGAGLSEPEVRRIQAIIVEDCRVELPLPEVWSRTIALFTLVLAMLEADATRSSAHGSTAGSHIVPLDGTSRLGN